MTHRLAEHCLRVRWLGRRRAPVSFRPPRAHRATGAIRGRQYPRLPVDPRHPLPCPCARLAAGVRQRRERLHLSKLDRLDGPNGPLVLSAERLTSPLADVRRQLEGRCARNTDQARDAMCRVDMFSDCRDMARSVMEATTCGLPVVSTPVNGIPEPMEHGHTGYAMPPQQAELLFAARHHPIKDPIEAASVGAAGRTRICVDSTAAIEEELFVGRAAGR
jgi:Glycosyl transferases group 1